MGVEDDINIGRSRYIKIPGVSSRFPEEDIPYKMILRFEEYYYTPSRDLIDVISIQKIQGETIVLPLPLQLNDNTTVKAGPASVGQPAIEAAKTGLQIGALGAGVSLAKYAKNTKGIAKVLLSGGAAVSGLLSTQTDAVLAAGGITTGITVNPFDTMMFEGVNLKKHSFSWKLSPSTKSESDSIRNIVNLLKKNSLPTYTLLGAGFKYPNIANIAFIGIDQEYYYKLKPAIITDISIKYNNSNDQLNVYRGGKPVVVELSIELTELTIHTAEDYGASFDTTEYNITTNTQSDPVAPVDTMGNSTGIQ